MSIVVSRTEHPIHRGHRGLCFGGLAVVLVGLLGLPPSAQGQDLLSRFRGNRDAKAQPASATVPTAPGTRERGDDDGYWAEVVAEVEGTKITRGELARELLEYHGPDHLQHLINRKLVEKLAAKHQVAITAEDVRRQVEGAIAELHLTRAEFEEQVLKPRKLGFLQYVRDMVWPELVLRKLLEPRIEITPNDLDRAFEANFGPMRDIRLLVTDDRRLAQELWQKVAGVTNPTTRLVLFENLCREHSLDGPTAADGGKCRPIHRYSAFPEIEKAAFDLQPGQLSDVLQVPEGFVLILCVRHVPAQGDVTLDTVLPERDGVTVRDVLVNDLKRKKLTVEMQQYFLEIRQTANVVNYLAEPGVETGLQSPVPQLATPPTSGLAPR